MLPGVPVSWVSTTEGEDPLPWEPDMILNLEVEIIENITIQVKIYIYRTDTLVWSSTSDLFVQYGFRRPLGIVL